jgi:hypothetical protein
LPHAPRAGAADEPCPLEHPNVLRHRFERHVEGFRELGHGPPFAREPFQNRTPRRVRERLEHEVDLTS